MDIAEILRGIGETVGAGTTVKSVYGEPVTSGQRTILPVASIRFAFGGGGGSGDRGTPHGDMPRRGGGGGGGRGSARPCGLVEVTPEGARFVYFQEPGRLAAAIALGFLAGLAVGFSLRRKARQKSV